MRDEIASVPGRGLTTQTSDQTATKASTARLSRGRRRNMSWTSVRRRHSAANSRTLSLRRAASKLPRRRFAARPLPSTTVIVVAPRRRYPAPRPSASHPAVSHSRPVQTGCGRDSGDVIDDVSRQTGPACGGGGRRCGLTSSYVTTCYSDARVV